MLLDANQYWNFGDIVVTRGILKGKLWWACPSYVVQDSAELVALYWPVGTPIRAPVSRPTVHDLLENQVELEDRHWILHDVLSLNHPGSGYSIELMWVGGTRNLRCWYVHLQEPIRRTQIGFDTMDQTLDIVISPNRSCWRWKDEDEFSMEQQIGVYSPQKAQSILAEGHHVIKLLESNAPPFCDGWPDWKAPAGWGIPKFPAGWENIDLTENIANG